LAIDTTRRRVRRDRLLLRALVAPLDALRELDLLSGGQQVDRADVLHEGLERNYVR
jgi:hypothetical protein